MAQYETSERDRARMRAVRGKDTAPEWAIRRLLFRLGYRYRLHASLLPGRPDIVFTRRMKVVFIHGCFWHSHDCPRGKRRPLNNQKYWDEKLTRNQMRDADNLNALARHGWKIAVIWECEVKDLRGVKERLLKFLGRTSAPPSCPSRSSLWRANQR